MYAETDTVSFGKLNELPRAVEADEFNSKMKSTPTAEPTRATPYRLTNFFKDEIALAEKLWNYLDVWNYATASPFFKGGRNQMCIAVR